MNSVKQSAVLMLLGGLVIAPASVTAGDSDPTIGLISSTEDVSPGYVLFTPLNSLRTYLIDNEGNLVNEWIDTSPGGNSVYLLDDGSLLRCSDTGPSPDSILIAGGDGGSVRRWDWEGNLLWDFEYSTADHRLHHDIEPMPNGNVLMIAWEYRSAEEAIAAGRDPALIESDGDNSVWPLRIIEVEPVGLDGGNIVWEWNLWDHLVQEFDPTKDNYGVVAENPRKVDLNFVRDSAADWIHTNSIDYNPQLDQILISTPFLNELWVIDHGLSTNEASGEAGDLLYRWGNPQAYDRGTADDQRSFFNHDARWVTAGYPGEGNITFFNNGRDRPDGSYSTIYEFTPPVNPDGSYDVPESGPFGPESGTVLYQGDPPTDFYSNFISGVERQPNGNTMFCKGRGGVFYEIDPAGEIVWLYVNPANSVGPLVQGCPPVGQNSFRCSRYPEDFPGFKGRDMTAGSPVERPRCRGDINCDGLVDGADLTTLLGFWGTEDTASDLDGDGAVDGADLTILLGNWGLCL